MNSEDNPLDDLFNDFDQEVSKTPAKSKPAAASTKNKRGKVYRNALDEQNSNRRQTAKATGKTASVAGKYMRRSFTYRPDQLSSIEELAGELGMSQNDLMRWFTDMGIDAIGQGEKPPLAEEIRRKYDPGLG